MDKVKTLQDYENYLVHRYRPGTAKVYSHAFGMWLSYLNGHNLNQENAQAYIDYLIKKKLSSSTVNLRGHAIKRWFRWKGKSIDLDYPTSSYVSREPQYLTIGQIEKLIGICTTPLEKALVIILFDTALRISELLNLKVDGIDEERGLLSVERKGGAKDLVNISDRGMKALKEWLEFRTFKTDRAFGNINYYDAWRIMRTIGKRAKIKTGLRAHMLRHSRAIHMLMSGATLHDVMMHLGHKSITTTANIYGRYRAVDLKERIPSW